MTPLARREARWGLLFISPWIIGFVLLTLGPMIATLVLTFFNATHHPGAAAPVRGARELPGPAQRPPGVGTRCWSPCSFALLWLPVTLIVPLGVALLLNSPRVRGAAGFRVLFFLPYVVPFVAGILIWQGMLDPQTGWVNGFLRLHRHPEPAGLAAGPGVGLPGPRVHRHLGHRRRHHHQPRRHARHPHGAVRRGAHRWRRQCSATLRHVTLPMLSPVIFYTLILGVVEVMQYFLVPLVIKNGTGEPDGSTLFYNLYLYKTFFTFQSMSYGATLAWALFLVTMLLTLVLFLISRRFVYYAGER